MSLGGGISNSVNTATNNAVAVGLVFVVAAGNDSANTCNYSPAHAANAITVGLTTSSEWVSSFSNYGSCVDVYAPGCSITAIFTLARFSTNFLVIFLEGGEIFTGLTELSFLHTLSL